MEQPKIDEEVWADLLDEIAADYSHGEIITHAMLKKRFGLALPDKDEYVDSAEFIEALQCHQFAYMTLVDKLRWQLLADKKYYMRNIRGEGYQVIQPREQVKFGFDSFIENVREAIRKAHLIMNNVRMVPSEQRSKDNELRAKCNIIKQMLLNIRK